MNAFDYWFDYIVRNGEFDACFWTLKIGNYSYRASKNKLTKLKCIKAFKDGNLFLDIASNSFFQPLSQERLLGESFKELISKRKII